MTILSELIGMGLERESMDSSAGGQPNYRDDPVGLLLVAAEPRGRPSNPLLCLVKRSSRIVTHNHIPGILEV
ncbi:hypothetical protein [Nocardia sp. CA-119907]|uniref:hypothetical protein n=1 Tax=Nocardia sp. CA-119907 TaxID=3239973 RepID=UPI003D953370